MDEITKERTISYGCPEGYHSFSPSSAMIVGTALMLKCIECGAEIQKQSPISGIPTRAEIAKEPEQKMETVPDTSRHGEPTLAPNPYEEINKRSNPEPPWAAQVKSRYAQDKVLDNFFDDIKRMANE